MKIDIFYFTDDISENAEWLLGDSYNFSLTVHDVVNTINKQVSISDADWIFFWDSAFGKPNTDLVLTLAEGKCDAWHAGLKLGLSGLPQMIDYIDPAWVYNKDPDDKIISSSFRLSIKACLIKADVYRKIGGLQGVYQSIEMAGISLGYSIIKQGGIIRYHPELIMEKMVTKIPEIDEWSFLRQFYTARWQYWVLLNKKSFLSNYRSWRRTRRQKYISMTPILHQSNGGVKSLPKESKVSVLAPTLNRYEYLHKELKQLSEQTIRPYEVLITDQTDIKNRQSIDADLYPDIDIIYFPQDVKGQCIAWNKLLKEAKGEYVLFLGDDADNIKPDFIAKLLNTLFAFNADIVASNVIEVGTTPKEINHHYYMSDTFPITLAKKEVVIKAGCMDMFFNKNIRADYDLALRCHTNGALMIFDSSALIDHHRASVGGLRTHNARRVTNSISKNAVLKFAEPTASEIFLVKKHFAKEQFRSFIRIKYFDQLLVRGGLFKKLVRIIVFILKFPSMRQRYIQNLDIANKELLARGILRY